MNIEMNITTEHIISLSILLVAFLLLFVGGMMGCFDSMAGPKYARERNMERFHENRVSEPIIRLKNGDLVEGLRVVDNRRKWREKFTALEVDSISEVRIVKKN